MIIIPVSCFEWSYFLLSTARTLKMFSVGYDSMSICHHGFYQQNTMSIWVGKGHTYVCTVEAMIIFLMWLYYSEMSIRELLNTCMLGFWSSLVVDVGVIWSESSTVIRWTGRACSHWETWSNRKTFFLFQHTSLDDNLDEVSAFWIIVCFDIILGLEGVSNNEIANWARGGWDIEFQRIYGFKSYQKLCIMT